MQWKASGPISSGGDTALRTQDGGMSCRSREETKTDGIGTQYHCGKTRQHVQIILPAETRMGCIQDDSAGEASSEIPRVLERNKGDFDACYDPSMVCLRLYMLMTLSD
jgi:hypothetical protein